MKKWWIGLMMLLVLIFPTTAMALMTPCSNCHRMLPDSAEKEFDYENDKSHRQYVICPYCGARNSIGLAFHYTTQKATCTSSAWCGSCKSYFGNTDPNAHNWGSWTPNTDGKTHTRVCENNSDHTETRNHTGGGATCTTAGTCTDCGAFYNDPDNHAGPYTYSYESSASSATQHTVTETCTGCGQISRTYDEDHDLVFHDAQAPTCMEGGWDAYETCSRCDYTTYVEKPALGHDIVTHDAKAPTCTEIGWDAYETCSRCDYTTYAEKSALGHDYAAKTTKPTCTEKGYTTHTCTRCQDSYRDGFVSALGHWYGEWAPNADGTHSATCRRGCGYRKTVPCTLLTCQLQSEAPYTAFTLCPVCGEVSDGTRLVLAEAAAKSVTGKLPAGEVVVRIGALAGGEQLMSVAFERSGELTRPTGQVKITLPAELLAGYTLSLLSEDGTETELALEADEKAETVSFVLDFTDSEIPGQVIRLVPEV